MRDAILKLVEEHIRVAAQYEAVGDATSAAELRGVANLVACLLDGREPGTILPPLTEENKTAIKAKERAVNDACEYFDAENAGKYPDWEEQLAYEEAAHRTIVMVLRKPKEASLPHWLDGIEEAVKLMRQRTQGA
jgi:hypothetical protein